MFHKKQKQLKLEPKDPFEIKNWTTLEFTYLVNINCLPIYLST